MAVNRRQFLVGGLAAAATSAGLTACGSGSGGGSGGGGDDGSAALAFAWWGNPIRNANTTQAIDLYTTNNSGITVKPQPGEWASYWDKLATQTAGGTAPDIIQMDMAYISEYGQRGALLDLSQYGADTSSFAEGTAASGELDGSLYGMNAGINTIGMFANPALFEKAGVPMPDDTTWTWDDLMDVSAQTAAGAGTPFGVALLFSNDAFFQAWLRQNDKALFTEDGGLGFEADDAAAWLDMAMKYQNAGATGSPSQIGEESTKSLDQSAIVVGTAPLQPYWSNQLEAVNEAAGTDLQILRLPSVAGSADQRQAWYKASMLWSASARSENPQAAVDLINWWVNSDECADINLAERGIPANTEVADSITSKLSPTQQTVAQFIADIEPELGEAPIAPPPGGGTLGEVLLRHYTDVLFGNASTSEAAQTFVDEVSSNISA